MPISKLTLILQCPVILNTWAHKLNPHDVVMTTTLRCRGSTSRHSLGSAACELNASQTCWVRRRKPNNGRFVLRRRLAAPIRSLLCWILGSAVASLVKPGKDTPRPTHAGERHHDHIAKLVHCATTAPASPLSTVRGWSHVRHRNRRMIPSHGTPNRNAHGELCPSRFRGNVLVRPKTT